MDRQASRYFEQFSGMDTRLLLERHRAGGLLPEAEDALRLVLEGRGFSQEELVAKAIRHPEADMDQHAAPIPTAKPVIDFPKSHPALRPFNLALKCLIIPVITLFVLLAVPILGNFIVIGGASLLGCNTGENDVHPCHFLGMYIGMFVYGYEVDIFILGGANPILALTALGWFVRSPVGIIWLVAVVGVYGARRQRRRRLMTMGD